MSINYTICNELVARARLQANVKMNKVRNETRSSSYVFVTNEIVPEKSRLGFAKEGVNSVDPNMKKFSYMLCHPMVIYCKVSTPLSSFYEIIPPNVPVKLFFDIDGSLPSLFCEAIENLLMIHYNEIITSVPPRIIFISLQRRKIIVPCLLTYRLIFEHDSHEDFCKYCIRSFTRF